MHDKIFEEQAKQGTGTITYGVTELKNGLQIGLDSAKFNQCLDSGKYKSEVKRSCRWLILWSVRNPRFYSNKRNETEIDTGLVADAQNKNQYIVPMPNGNYFISGAQPFSVFKAIIDPLLGK